ncbi:MAG: cysteine desulfurase NifS [Candidatus Wallbacteria bacterium HGW-Wallbacteria-1]|jgi:cysteine desulfurase|uniref:cysteine desulfurase n=1 Tax=Candidatus Wallbacteria bacterium HGW-Wallbacteria-1 TaxID=2013854 RepID=A0A2N1PLE0_9BACT|nr:MAG: cysteine desulfurase NifS [Candidatus Wallbacteria bacterium HGW-Wallbacteria-1]
MDRIYLDNNATTQVDPRVVNKVVEAMSRDYGNPSSPHALGRSAAAILDSGREIISSMINCEPEEIFFFSGGTEANNSAVRGAAECEHSVRKAVIFSAVEHPCVKGVYFKYLKSHGYPGGPVSCDANGVVSLDSFIAAIQKHQDESGPGIALVSLMHANNETGVIQPIEETGRICAEQNITFHSDGVQSFGKIPVDVKRMNLGMFGASSHKIHGPKGAGFLYIRKGTHFSPTFFGGHQQGGVRVGTEAVPALAGFFEACRIASQEMTGEAERVGLLRNRFEEIVTDKLPESRINGGAVSRVPGTTNMTFPGVAARELIPMLDEMGVTASAGSACANSRLQKNTASPVLAAMGLSDSDSLSSVRFSFGRFNTIVEAEIAAGIVVRAVELLK